MLFLNPILQGKVSASIGSTSLTITEKSTDSESPPQHYRQRESRNDQYDLSKPTNDMHINAKMFPGKQITSQAITTFTVNIFDEEQQDASSDVFCSMFRCFFLTV